jgi:hypothetical protein
MAAKRRTAVIVFVVVLVAPALAYYFAWRMEMPRW